MNVFVLCTGRCGSKSFSRACEHIENYTVGFELKARFIEHERLSYPSNHIEVDNRLSWFLGRLDEKYGDGAFYVHLKRNSQKVAESYVRRYNQGILKAYRGKGILLDVYKDTPPINIALDYCNTVNSNIGLFLKDKTQKMEFHIENYQEDFISFCKLIKARCDLKSALKEFGRKHNASRRMK